MKRFYSPEDPSKILSCLELYDKYIIENTNECIDKPEKGYFISNNLTGLISPCHSDCETCSINYTEANLALKLCRQFIKAL